VTARRFNVDDELLPLRRQVARELIDFDFTETMGIKPIGAFDTFALAAPEWPDASLKPVLVDPEPIPKPGDPLPEADWLVITWTIDEHKALKDVFAPSLPVERWFPYTRKFDSDYRPLIKKGAPALRSNRLGSYCLVKINEQRVLCLKSELHLNQDGVQLPLHPLTHQLIDETKAGTILSIGTAGGVANDDELGDVAVSRSALFRCADEFEEAPFNGKSHTSNWNMKKKHFEDAKKMMIRIQEPKYAHPTTRIGGAPPSILLAPNDPNIVSSEKPILTTDFFEFGTSANHLDEIGCAVEMDDAVIAMACDESARKPRYAFVRNVSDPVINADLEKWTQIMWAVGYYKEFGRETSYNGALATWAIIAANS
jgi:nucleoside phosphorylase